MPRRNRIITREKIKNYDCKKKMMSRSQKRQKERKIS